MAGEDVDLKVFRAAVALGERKAIALDGALSSTCAEQHLIDGKGCDLCPSGLVDNSKEKTSGIKTKTNLWTIVIMYVL